MDFAVSLAATYSASVDERATEPCLTDFQKTVEYRSYNKSPVVDLRSDLSPAQSES